MKTQQLGMMPAYIVAALWALTALSKAMDLFSADKIQAATALDLFAIATGLAVSITIALYPVLGSGLAIGVLCIYALFLLFIVPAEGPCGYGTVIEKLDEFFNLQPVVRNIAIACLHTGILALYIPEKVDSRHLKDPS